MLAVDPVVKSITGGTPFEFDVADGRTPSLSQIDGSQYLCAYEGSGSDGWAVVLTVDTGTWTISAETPFEFDSGTGTEPALVELSDGRHVCSYQGAGDDGYAGVLEISEGVLP